MTRVQVETVNNEDNYMFQMEIFDNGRASIYMSSRERESISYSGRMEIR